MPRPIALAAVLGLLSAAAPAMAQDQHWAADSTTAMAVTGDVRFLPVRLTFANGASLPLQFVRIVPGLTWMPDAAAKTTPASLFRITTPQNPKLLGGNFLCGAKPPTYVTVARKDGSIFLSVYDDAIAPALPGNHYCAGYDYSLAR